MRHRLGFALILSLALLAGLNGAARSDDVPTATIQPGDLALSGATACTFGFAFNGTGPRAGRVYFVLAAHCFDEHGVGSEVAIDTDEIIGDVVALGDSTITSEDWSLVEVRSSAVARVRGDVRGLPAYPLGFTVDEETTSLDGVRMSGWGIPFFIIENTREGRWGTMGSDDDNVFNVTAPIFKGDSGGPVVHAPTGKAIGLVSRLCAGMCTTEGPTVAGILARAAAAGYPLALRLAGQ